MVYVHFSWVVEPPIPGESIHFEVVSIKAYMFDTIRQFIQAGTSKRQDCRLHVLSREDQIKQLMACMMNRWIKQIKDCYKPACLLVILSLSLFEKSDFFIIILAPAKKVGPDNYREFEEVPNTLIIENPSRKEIRKTKQRVKGTHRCHQKSSRPDPQCL